VLAQMHKMRAKDATYRKNRRMSDRKTVKRILDPRVDERMLLKPETSPAKRAGKEEATSELNFSGSPSLDVPCARLCAVPTCSKRLETANPNHGATMVSATDRTTTIQRVEPLLAILPIFVERNPRKGNLFFRSCPDARKRPLPRDPTTAEFNRAYHAALVAAGEDDRDDWSGLVALHAAQREAKHRAQGLPWFVATGESGTERAERDVAHFARLVLLEDPALDPVVVRSSRGWPAILRCSALPAPLPGSHSRHALAGVACCDPRSGLLRKFNIHAVNR
jgi:hypothetical protein